MIHTFIEKNRFQMISLIGLAVFLSASYSAEILSAADDKAGSANSRYTLPPSKKFIESCRTKAQLLHSGSVEKQQILKRHGDFWLRYEIQARDGSEWLVLCDLANGEIVNQQELIDSALRPRLGL